ncbi:MAG TPA: aminoacetone oxidase family FAD-binding enzyme, partial [Flavobacterium sp.]|nr:aminoacetone oxidase family FAD-binding enzyme [Flavobacterium sp.]
GKKLLITGGGRCNITNAEFDIRTLTAKYGPKGKALIGSFTRFGVAEVFQFFKDRDLDIKVEAEKRAFPTTNKAEDVWKVLVGYLQKGKVEILYDSPVKEIQAKNEQVSGLKLESGKVIVAKNYIVATGGKSRPETGSTGEGFKWLHKLGHTVDESNPALVPIKIKDAWVKSLSGLSFASAKLTVFQDGIKQESQTGKILLTHFGISGPLALNMSKSISELHKYGPVNLELDICPDEDVPELDARILKILDSALSKKIKNTLGEAIPSRMVNSVLKISEVDPDKFGNALTREERMKLVKTLKALPMQVTGFLGVEKAIVSSGGVSLKEVDFKNMQSKLYPNLYLAGDILNFDKPSGGYSLQICWTTGYLAGTNAAGETAD